MSKHHIHHDVKATGHGQVIAGDNNVNQAQKNPWFMVPIVWLWNILTGGKSG